jgi:DNA-binding NarL/FixJ family response regulator
MPQRQNPPESASVRGIADRRQESAGADPAPIRVALADDSFLMREAVTQVLAREGGVEVVAICEDGDQLIAAVERELPDVVITDVRMPPSGDEEGIRVAQRLRASYSQIGVVVLTQYAEPRYALDLLADGAEGRAYLLKDRVHDSGELHAAIEVVARGGSMIDPAILRLLLETEESRNDSPLMELTPREREVLAAMASGKSNAAIAAELFLTKRAVEKHVGAIFQKLGLPDEDQVSRRVAAVLLYLADRQP